MPGRLFLEHTNTELGSLFGVAPPDPFLPRYNIAPGQDVLTLVEASGMQSMRWGIIPVGRKNARGRPVMETIVNARSETVFEKSAFSDLGRCLVPASGWYEWTGKARRKTAWRIRPAAGGILVFAGVCDIWRAPGGIELAQVATLTCPPSPDVAQIHDRMGVIVRPEDFDTWLTGDVTRVRDLMIPLPAGALHVEEALGVDWDAP